MSLVGRWVMVAEDETRTAEFHADGTMHYVIVSGGREMVLDLQYRVEGAFLVTDRVRSSFELIDDALLVMTYGGETFTFRRG